MTADALRLRMEAAAAAMDFEEAARLRDQLSLLRGWPVDDPAPEVDTSRMTRQQPGAMGLGTGEPRVARPPAGRRHPSPIR